MPQKIWSNPGNPPRGIATRLGITRRELGRAIHKIKDHFGLSPRDRVTIWDDGSVTDENDVPLGNIQDEI
jgi:hypothetical protein